MSVALHTSAGEGDLSSDRLSHLKIIGSGFGPLIYGLKIDSSFLSFQRGCEAVWKALVQTPQLPKLLVSILYTPFFNFTCAVTSSSSTLYIMQGLYICRIHFYTKKPLNLFS